MVWTRLFKIKNFQEALKPQLINNRYRKPELSGRKLANVRKIFLLSRIPFIYDKRYINNENHPYSPYHKFPKKFGKQETYILTRMAKLRNNLIISKERELKVRQEKINKQKLTGLDKAFKELMPFLIKPQKVTKILDEDKKKTRKKESEYVKGIPVFNKVVKRKDQEKMKNLLVDGIAEKEDFANK